MDFKKYRLLEGFTKNVVGGTAEPVYFKKKKGDIVEGFVRINPSTNKPTALLVPFIVNGRRTNVSIPIEILKKDGEYSRFEGENTENNPTSIFTMRNVIMGLVGIAVVYGILKVTKIIK